MNKEDFFELNKIKDSSKKLKKIKYNFEIDNKIESKLNNYDKKLNKLLKGLEKEKTKPKNEEKI